MHFTSMIRCYQMNASSTCAILATNIRALPFRGLSVWPNTSRSEPIVSRSLSIRTKASPVVTLFATKSPIDILIRPNSQCMMLLSADSDDSHLKLKPRSCSSDQCTMVPLSTKSCLKSNKLRPILNGQFYHAIFKNIGLNLFGSKQPREILVFVILKL